MTNALEAPFEMANLFPKTTGLPFVVWISERGRVLAEANMGAEEFALLRTWIERNRQVLVEYWNSEIDTAEAISRLVRL